MKAITKVGLAGLTVWATAMVGPMTAQAEPMSNEDAAIAATCFTLDEYPSMSGVQGSISAMRDQGMTGVEIGQVLGLATRDVCPEYRAIVMKYIDRMTAVRG